MDSRLEILQEFLDQLHGLVVVDRESNIVFIDAQYANALGYDDKEIIGLPVKQIIPNSKLPVVLESGKAIWGDVFCYLGHTSICNRWPLMKDGKIIGAVSYSVFDRLKESDNLFESLQELRGQLDYYRDKLKMYSGARYTLADIVGTSDGVVELHKAILRAGCTDSTVLIQGETGTGKELVAHSLHQESLRTHHPFIKLNCAAMPYDLIESELFGYEEGAFTGARKTGKKGKFELANKGTLFLDEVSQLTMPAQAKLLRALQEKEIERVGGTTPVSVNVRIVAASNDDLEAMVKQGTFRSDLFYRLNVVPIKIPPLRERMSDIPALVKKFVEKYGEQAGLGPVEVSPEALDLLQGYGWPGNIRELENAVERAVGLCRTGLLDISHFEWLMPKIQKPFRITNTQDPIKEAKDAAERNVILNILHETGGNITKAAEVLHMDRSLLYQKMRRLGIKYRQ
ncbi:MAG: sigma 54-interacting transcriptional regulator [Negativicutes bacterium]|nr:sigma 54-interacting transcriptional regulator [Negativicutes bacterium]